MGRIRTIKPELPHSESMGRVSRDARLCFIMLWTIVDDDGRARGNSRMLASLLYPYDDDAGALMGGWLEELETEGCITRYQVAGDWYLEVENWRKHQKIDHPSGSRLPPRPDILAKPREASRSLAPDLGPRTSTSTKDLGPKRGAKAPPIKSTRRPNGSRISADWQVDDAGRAFADGLGLDPDSTSQEFRDYWLAKAGPAGIKADWKATWRNWCRRSAAGIYRPAGRGKSGGIGSNIAEAVALAAQIHDAQRRRPASDLGLPSSLGQVLAGARPEQDGGTIDGVPGQLVSARFQR